MAKSIKIAGASFADVPSLRIPLASGSGYAEFIDKDDAGGGGDTKNVQVYFDFNSTSATSYTATNTRLTVAKTGKYTVGWIGIRNTTSGTSGSQLYINGTAYGSAQTSGWTTSYVQMVKLTNVSLTAGQEIVVRARARSTSYTMNVGHLVIEEV